MNVLVVEDEFLLLSELKLVLRDAGASTVHACRTIPEAIAALDGSAVAAAILDIRIGRESIAPVARKLAGRNTPFLFYTGQMGSDRIILEWPDTPILSKPAPADRIVAALANLLERTRTLSRHSA